MTVDSAAAHHPTRTFDPVSVSPLSFWAQTAEERERSFKILRDERPISWHPPIEGSLAPAPVDGVWVVTRHEDISYVSKNPELFCSGGGRDDRGHSRGAPGDCALVHSDGRGTSTRRCAG